jgi:uncharacterized protein (TIRG00374 family)
LINFSIMNNSRFIRIVIRIILTLVFLSFIFKLLDFSDIWLRLTEFDQRLLFLIGVIFLTHMIAFAVRWYDIACNYANLGNFPWFFRQTMISYLFNQIALGTLGGDAFRIYSMVKIGFTLDQSTSSIIIERLGIFVIACLQALLSLLFIGYIKGNGIILISFSVGVLCILLSFALLWSIAYQKMGIFSSDTELLKRLAPLAKFLKDFLGSFKMFRVMLCSIYISITSCVIYWLVAYGLGYETNLMTYLLAAPFPILISMVPITISGWGVREMAFGLVLSMLGRSSIEGVTVSGIVGLLIMITGLPGALMLLMQRIGNYFK